MSSQAEALPKRLVTAVLLMTFAVFGLGAAVLAIKLRPQPVPTTTIDRNLVSWKAAVDANPKDDVARTAYGIALLDAGQTDEAFSQFQEAVHLNKKNWVALFQLGLLNKATSANRAVQLLATSAKYAPSGSKTIAFVAEGDLLLQTGDLEGAKTAYRNAIADAPYVFDAHLGLAKTLERLGDPKGALKEYQQAARFAPDDQEVADAIARLTGSGSATPTP